MAILGAHMSIAGGYFKAVEVAREQGCDCVQLFTKNNNQWRAKDLTPEDVTRFQSALTELRIGYPIAHNSYLINLAAPDDELWRKSIEAHRVELERAERLGIPHVVAHPGAFTSSSEEAGLARIVAGLDEIHAATPGLKTLTLLETTAGQGSCLGHRFEHLATILAGVKHPERLAVCVDTCHVFAAGYSLGTAAEYRNTMEQLTGLVGLERIKAFHLNDSVKPLGSRVDRHAHIGKGCLGFEPFRHLLNDARFVEIPMYLETPKETVDGEHMDAVNLRVLRSLIKKPTKSRV
jgi:deoxyribonuclease-4